MSEPKAGIQSPPSFPRRNQLQLMTPAEKAIYEASQAVERAGAHPLLTDVVNLLSQTRDKLADYIDFEQRVHLGINCVSGSQIDFNGPKKEALAFLEQHDHEGSSLALETDRGIPIPRSDIYAFLKGEK